jgi:hypothetical protein
MTVKIIFLLTIISCVSGCLSMDTECCDHVDTYSISKGLYIERYRTFCAGVFGELTDCYITDSISFRQKIATYDEHESFYAEFDSNKIVAYNFLSGLISDTIEKKSILKTDLWKHHHTDTNCLKTTPLFGKNTITCDTDFFPASSYKTDDGIFMSEVQYKCGSDYSNAVFYTDSLNFSVFIGVNIPGSFENQYTVKANGTDGFDFYNVTLRRTVDTVKVETYLLNDLQKGKLIKVCK